MKSNEIEELNKKIDILADSIESIRQFRCEQLKEQLDHIDDQINNLRADIEGMCTEKEDVLRSKRIKNIVENNLHYYYYVCIDGVSRAIYTAYWRDTKLDQFRLAIGNVFPTYGEAAEYLEELKVLSILWKHAAPGPYPTNLVPLYQIALHDGEIKICKFASNFISGYGIFFKTEKDANDAIDECGYSNLIKYYFHGKVKEG